MKHLPLLLLLAIVTLGCAAEETVVNETTAPVATETTANATPQTPPCDWITEAEATEVLGQPSKYGSTAVDGSSNCVIDPVADGSGLSVDFRVNDDQSAWDSESMMAETISGLGDAAVWNAPGTIAVKKGDRYLFATISRAGAPAGDLKTPATAFARRIAEKM